MECVGHWWNGSWGRLARRDVYLHRDGVRWLVQARAGGADGRSTWREHHDETDARGHVLLLLTPPDQWRELT